MNSKLIWRILGGLGILFILCSIIIAVVEYRRFIQRTAIFPDGSTIAGVLVGGLEKVDSEIRIADFYALPFTLEIEGTTVQVDPALLGFEMDSAALVEEAAQQLTHTSFFNYLWHGLTLESVDVPLTAIVDDDILRTYLQTEIVPRYTDPGTALVPIPFTTNFEKGNPGKALDLDQAAANIKAGLLSPETHSAVLFLSDEAAAEATMQALQAFLVHNIDNIGFDELVEIYLESMDTGQTLHFAVQDGTLIEPDIAFTAASTIKIPIMLSVLRRLSEPIPKEVIPLFEEMIVFSENTPADTLMEYYLDETRGPLVVSEDMHALGFGNTFLAGYFYLGAPLLQRFETPANTRVDIDLDPDDYNQTVSSEAGELLSAIYACAVDGTGLLTDTFPEEITQSECQLMIDILSGNKIGVLIEAGVAPDAIVAHKHGWTSGTDGLLHSMSDVAIVYTAGGNYVLNVFAYDPVQLTFDEGNWLFARLSQTVYNFFNSDDQLYWWFD
jgi:beta-lactamase class A